MDWGRNFRIRGRSGRKPTTDGKQSQLLCPIGRNVGVKCGNGIVGDGSSASERQRRMAGQAMTEYVLTLIVVVLPLAPVVISLLNALSAYFDRQASLLSLPIP